VAIVVAQTARVGLGAQGPVFGHVALDAQAQQQVGPFGALVGGAQRGVQIGPQLAPAGADQRLDAETARVAKDGAAAQRILHQTIQDAC